MKRLTIIAMALCLALAWTVPAMAVEADFSGEFKVAGQSYDDIIMSGPKDRANFYNMALDLKGKFKITDNISLTTQMKALDKDWGLSNTPVATTGTLGDVNNADDNFEFRSAYVTIKTPVGGLLAGRFVSSPWGTNFADSEGENDQIVFFVPVGNWSFAAVARKMHEFDGSFNVPASNIMQVPANAFLSNEKDNDKYFITAKYKTEQYEAGFLYAKYALNNYVDENYTPIEADINVINPYFIGHFGDFRIQAEGAWGFGTGYYINYLSTNAQFAAGAVGVGGPGAVAPGTAVAAGTSNPENPGQKERDVKAHMYNIEGDYTFGPVTVGGGYAAATGMIVGNGGTNAGAFTGIAWMEYNQDWGKAFILNNFHEFSGGSVLGNGVDFGNAYGSNLSQSFSAAAAAGMKAFYLEGSYSPREDLTIGALWMTSKADKVRTGWGDDHGDEYDLSVSWKPMDNLEYKIIYAKLKAGDFWKGPTAATTAVGDPEVWYNELTITF